MTFFYFEVIYKIFKLQMKCKLIHLPSMVNSLTNLLITNSSVRRKLLYPILATEIICIVENDKKKRLRNFLKTYERPLADFCHSLHVQVVKIPKKNNPISSDCKKEFNEFTKQSIFTLH